jgi:hypothetical protein
MLQPVIVLLWSALAVGVQDTSIINAVRAAAELAPVETFGDEKGSFRVREIQLLDVDGDGAPEAFVWIDPSVQQTPTILVYTYDTVHGPRRMREGLVPGLLTPVSGRLVDDHTMGVGIDIGVGSDGKPVDVDKLLDIAVRNGFSLVRYATFIHSDVRTGFVSYVDLHDLTLPAPVTNTCEAFEFSPIEAMAAGTLSGKGGVRYLVALTAHDVTFYQFRGIRPNGMLDKQVWIRPRPRGAAGLSLSPKGEVSVTMANGRVVSLTAP